MICVISINAYDVPAEKYAEQNAAKLQANNAQAHVIKSTVNDILKKPSINPPGIITALDFWLFSLKHLKLIN